MHPTSLPSQFGVGSLGDEAKEFIDVLAKTHVSLWQILPLGPTGYGDSPYAARSTFAGNELLIDLKSLACEGYLDLDEMYAIKSENLSDRVDYQRVRELKEPLLDLAATKFLSLPDEEKTDYEAFCAEKSDWLDDYALYSVLCSVYNDSRWFSMWPLDVRKRKPHTLATLTKTYQVEIEKVKALQFFFFSQWAEIKKYANDRGIRIIGDIPIFVAPDSVDAWCHVDLLKMDKDFHQIFSSGVPPDLFSSTGQLWGNPVYNWKNHVKTNFAWWTERVRETFQLCDIIRIDHFRGLSAYWEVPSGDTTAQNGKWVSSPGKELIAHLKEELGSDMEIIAEDLGVITPDVEELRDSNGFPGMKILQFAFNFNEKGTLDSTNAYLPHNCDENSVIYTGTHDNDTTQGWFNACDERTKDLVRRYLECPNDQVLWQMLRVMLMSRSRWAILPMQDLLGLGSEGRMNTPSTCGQSNWSWKLKSLDLDAWRLNHLREMIDLYGRYEETEEKQ